MLIGPVTLKGKVSEYNQVSISLRRCLDAEKNRKIRVLYSISIKRRSCLWENFGRENFGTRPGNGDKSTRRWRYCGVTPDPADCQCSRLQELQMIYHIVTSFLKRKIALTGNRPLSR